MSAPGRMVVGVVAKVIVAAAQPGETSAQLLSTVKAALADVTVELARQVLKEVLTDLAVSISKDAASIVPVIGALVNVVIDVIAGMGAATGTGPSNANIAVRRAWCVAQYRAIRGTGPGMSVLPADYFSTAASPNAFGELYRSSVGEALIAITETPVSLAQLRSAAKALNAVGNTSMNWVNDSKLGISAKAQLILKALRMAMEKSWKTSDGGASLWPVYLDLIRAEFDAGRMNEKFALYLYDKFGADPLVTQNVLVPGETSCAFHDDRPVRQVLDLVRGWKQAVSPFYTQYQGDVAAAETAAIDAADEAAKKRISTASTFSPMASVNQKIALASVLTKAPPTSPVVSIAAGAGLAAAALALLL